MIVFFPVVLFRIRLGISKYLPAILASLEGNYGTVTRILVWEDHLKSPKVGLARPNLAIKIDPTWLTMVQSRILVEFMPSGVRPHAHSSYVCEYR